MAGLAGASDDDVPARWYVRHPGCAGDAAWHVTAIANQIAKAVRVITLQSALNERFMTAGAHAILFTPPKVTAFATAVEAIWRREPWVTPAMWGRQHVVQAQQQMVQRGRLDLPDIHAHATQVAAFEGLVERRFVMSMCFCQRSPSPCVVAVRTSDAGKHRRVGGQHRIKGIGVERQIKTHDLERPALAKHSGLACVTREGQACSGLRHRSFRWKQF